MSARLSVANCRSRRKRGQTPWSSHQARRRRGPRHVRPLAQRLRPLGSIEQLGRRLPRLVNDERPERKKAAVSRKRRAAAGKAAATRRANRGRQDADPRAVLRRLLAASRIRASESDVVSQDQGLYVLWTAGRKATCLKVGIAGPRKGKGLWQRLHLHYVSNAANSVLARHLAADRTSQWATSSDLRDQRQRQAFLATTCFFRVLPVPQVSRSALLRLESFLVERLKPLYAGSVNKTGLTLLQTSSSGA
jgi:hypothetical protein